MKAKHVYIYLVGVVCIGCFSFSNLNAQNRLITDSHAEFIAPVN